MAVSVGEGWRDGGGGAYQAVVELVDGGEEVGGGLGLRERRIDGRREREKGNVVREKMRRVPMPTGDADIVEGNSAWEQVVRREKR